MGGGLWSSGRYDGERDVHTPCLVCVCVCMRCACVSGRVCVSTRVCSVYMSYVSMCSCVCVHVCLACVRGSAHLCAHALCTCVPCVREQLCVRCPRRPPGTVPQPQSRVGGVGAVSASGSVLGCRWARSSWSGNSLESPGTHRVTHLGPPHSAAAASGFPGARPGRPRCDPGCSEAEARPRSADGAPERGGLAADRDGAGVRPALRASLRVRVPCPCGPAVSRTACDLRVAFVHGDDMQRDSRVARSARPAPGAPLAITATAFL